MGNIIDFMFKKPKITLTANAKINLVLDICGKRKDGYHLIDTVMQSVTLGDKITVSKADIITVDCTGTELAGENNIAYKSAKLFFEEISLNKGANIKIEKHIPQAAGLGGGSADAAGVLLALNEIYNAGFSEEKLCEIGLRLGADVPFFIKGGTQRTQGIGEILTEITPLKSGYFLLVKQGEKPSTGEMYRRLDSEEHPHPNVAAVINAVEQNDIKALADGMDNSFIAVNRDFVLYEKLKELGAVGISLSGSGPTWFALFDNSDLAETAFCTLKRSGIECYLTRPCKNAVVFE